MYKAIPKHPEHIHIRERQWFIADQTQGKEELEFVFFFGGIYSQWAYSPFYHTEHRFPTAEHFMMYHKAMVFKDYSRASLILSDDDPKHAKKIGRSVSGYDENKWNLLRYNIVVMANILKFSQNPDFFDAMLQDSDKALVEASPYDKIWGIGKAATEPHLDNVDNWNGLNLLGYAIMEARERLLGMPHFNNMGYLSK